MLESRATRAYTTPMNAACLLLAAALFPVEPTQELGVRLEPAWPNLPRLERPLDVGQFPDGRYWIAEQGGRIVAFRELEPNQAGEMQTILELPVSRRGNEEGLLSFCPHPKVAANGRVFVHRSMRGEARGRIEEYRMGADGRIDPATERLLLEVPQPWRNHNGGQLAFGPDGMLYIGLGDGGAAGDPKQSGQDVGSLLGAILRIDVDGEPGPDLPYAIPKDNPFVGTPGARGELWAIGLRNPWRFSFDPATDRLWCGDVGQVAFEEVSVIVRGGNYGWKLREGFAPYEMDARRGPGELLEPVHAYPRDVGISITGGFVYRGEKVKGLVGQYVFADFGSHRIFALPASAADTPQKGPHGAPAIQIAEVREPAGFGLDNRGELYVASFDGRVHRFVSAEGP